MLLVVNVRAPATFSRRAVSPLGAGPLAEFPASAGARQRSRPHGRARGAALVAGLGAAGLKSLAASLPGAVVLGAATRCWGRPRRGLKARRRVPRHLYENRNGLIWETGVGYANIQRVVVVGGGPGGLALACGLARLRGLQVIILEGRSARESSAQHGRSHTIGLGRRAREALIAVGGGALWERIKRRGMVAGGFTLHLNGVALNLPAPEGEPVLLVDRGEIVAALTEHLAACPRGAGTEVSIRRSTKVRSVDFARRAVVIEREGAEEVLPYDLLVGADGVRSRVREAMNSQLPSGRFESELRLMPGRWQVLHMSLPPTFQAEGVHALVSSEAPFGLFCIPNPSGQHCVIISWSSDETPTELLGASTPEELEALLLRYFPSLGAVPRETALRFLSTRPSKAVASRCRPLHDADAAVCLMGDAAHAVGGGSLGQGCSAALQDAASLAFCIERGVELAAVLRRTALNSALERGGQQEASPQEWAAESQEAIASALATYSEQRAAEGWALLDLIELQSAAEVRAGALVQGPVVMGFFIEQLGRGTLRPLAELGSRLLTERLQINSREVAPPAVEVGEPAIRLTPAVLFFLFERAVLSAWKFLFDFLASKLKPAMQTSLMATDEPYSQLVERNRTWLALLQSAKAAAGVSMMSFVRSVHVLSGLNETDAASWAQNFTLQERLKDDILVRQSGPAAAFFAIRMGSCRVLRNNVELAVLGPGDSFGEVALLLGTSSPISVVAATDVTLLVMPGKAFLNLVSSGTPQLRQAVMAAAESYGAGMAIVEQEQREGRQRIRSLLQGSTFIADTAADLGSVSHVGLQDLPMPRRTDVLIDQLLGTVGCDMYSQGEVIGLGCQQLRVVECGECTVVRGGRQVRALHPGDFFGPDLAENERVVAVSPEVRICRFEETTSAGILASLLKA